MHSTDPIEIVGPKCPYHPQRFKVKLPIKQSPQGKEPKCVSKRWRHQ